MKLYLGEDVPAAIADALRRQKVDVLTTQEAGNAQTPDAAQLQFATAARRCTVTRNVKHFSQLAQRAVCEQRPHAGIVLISAGYQGNEVRRITEGILRLIRAHPDGLEAYGVRYL